MKHQYVLRTWLTTIFSCCSILLAYGQVVINEFSCSNKDSHLDIFNEYEDWIEFYNTGVSNANISGYFLTDKQDEKTKWAFPVGTNIPAGGRLRIFCSGRDTVLFGEIHTGYKLTQMKQEYIILSSAVDTSVMDSIWINEPTQRGHSRGRETDGAASWEVFPNPTPNASNNGATGYQRYLTTPVFDQTPGFYPGAITLTLSTTEPGATIRYTTNGDEPSLSSTLYSSPLNISATTIIRAKCFSSNPALHYSFTESNTYFINENHSYPVLSVASADFDDLFTGTPEIMSSFELFDANDQFQFEMDGDFRGHGNDSWAFQQKGIRFYVRDQYGYANKIDYQIFPSSTRTDFDVVIIRNAGSDNYPGGSNVFGRPTCHVRDGYIQTLAEDHNLNVDTRKYQPCVVYLNGQYWGVYEMRERIDADYTKYYHDQGEKWVDMLEFWGGLNVRYGDPADWNSLYTYMMSNNLAIPANYNYVLSEIDEMSFLDYFILNTHIVNTDWLNWNTKWWRGTKPPNPTGWRYTFWDMDNVFNLGQNYTGVNTTTYLNDPCDPQTLFPGDPSIPHMDMINALLANPTFYDLYINRYADLLNTTLNCDTMLAHFDAMIASLAVEMPQQIARWGGTMADWNQNVQFLRNEIVGRCAVIDSLIVGCYQPNIGPKERLVVNVSPANAGTVQVNTITPSNYPWDGEYFTSVNLSFQANANATYTFDHWEVFNHSPLPGTLVDSMYFDFQSADSIVAVFLLNFGMSGTTVNDDCNGSGTGEIALVVNGGLAPFTFAWSNGATTQDLTGLQAGSYNVTITDANSNTVMQSFLLVNNAAPSVSSSTTVDDCFPAGSGTIDVAISGGTGPYTFAWSDGSTTEDLVGLVAGNYTLTITDASNCTLTETAVVVQHQPPTASTNALDVTCFGFSDGAIDLTVSNGTTPYTFAWNTGGNAEDINNIIAGTYSVTVTDVNGCTVSTSSIVAEPSPLSLALDVTNIQSGSDGQIRAIVSGGSTPYNYLWNDPSAQTSPTAIGLEAGFYSVTVTDAGGCLISEQGEVEQGGVKCINKVMTFTPNNDGMNDTWEMDCLFAFSHRVMVYNRWGQVVFQSENYDSRWDGAVDGVPLPDGGYYFIIEYTDLDGNKEVIDGALNIIR